MTRLFSIVGTPSPLTQAILVITRACVQVVFGEHIVVCANTLQEMRAGFPSRSTRGDKPVIFISDFPQPDLRFKLLEAGAPMVICSDNLAAIAYLAIITRNFAAVDAARHASMALVNIEPLMSAPPPFSTVVNDPKVGLSESIAQVSSLYKLDLNAEKMREVLALLGCEDASTTSLGDYSAKIATPLDEARELLERRSPLENGLIDFLAPQYDGIARGSRLEKLEWPVYALLRPEFPDRLTIGPVDLTGPARFIYFGPYFALPAGAWSAQIAFEVQGCYSENWIALDINADKVLATIKTKLPTRGMYECQIRFRIVDPAHRIEVRVRLLTGAIEGVMRMHSIKLNRLANLDEAESGWEDRKAASMGVQ
jgi:hypothetical protein